MGSSDAKRLGVVDVLVAVALAGMLAFPFVAMVEARNQGVAFPDAAASLPPLQRSPTGSLRDLPSFTPGGTVERAVNTGTVLTDQLEMTRVLGAALVDLVRPEDADTLLRLIADGIDPV